MAECWTLKFHGMPPGANEYKGGNRHKVAKDTKTWRSYGAEMATTLAIPPFTRVKLDAVFFRRNLGVADEDNDRSRLKPIVDGLRDARVIQNDTRRYIVWGKVEEAHGQPGLELTMSSLSALCFRCGSDTDDVKALTDEVHLCFTCYARFVREFLTTKHGYDCVSDYLEAWKQKKNER